MYYLWQVSPANSFGFMDGGIDLAYSLHFGWQMYEYWNMCMCHCVLFVCDTV